MRPALTQPPRRSIEMDFAVTIARFGAICLTLLLEKSASSSAREIFGSRPSTNR